MYGSVFFDMGGIDHSISLMIAFMIALMTALMIAFLRQGFKVIDMKYMDEFGVQRIPANK